MQKKTLQNKKEKKKRDFVLKYENKLIQFYSVMQTGLSSVRSLVSVVSHMQPTLSNCLFCLCFIPDLPKYIASVQQKNGYNH